MKLSSLQFVLQQFETERYKYFVVCDDLSDVQVAQMENVEPSVALTRLRSFLKNNTGYYEIFVFDRRIDPHSVAARDRKYIAKYAVQATSESQTGISSVSLPIPGFSHTVLPADDPRNGAPNSWDMFGRMGKMETEMLLMKNNYENEREKAELMREIERLKSENEKSKGWDAITRQIGGILSNPTVLMGALGVAGQAFNAFKGNGGASHPAPMNGVSVAGMAEDTIMETSAQTPNEQKFDDMNGKNNRVDQAVNNNLTERQKRMVSAINDLQRIDPAFPENIEKLAVLARTNLSMYKMAVQYLSSM